MTSVLPALTTAALVTVIGICLPFAMTPILGITRGIDGSLFAALIGGWFLQGLALFALPLMLLTRLPPLRSPAWHAATGVAINIVIGVALHLWNAGRGRSMAFSLGGLVLFSLGGAAAGLYLFRRRAVLPGVR